MVGAGFGAWLVEAVVTSCGAENLDLGGLSKRPEGCLLACSLEAPERNVSEQVSDS